VQKTSGFTAQTSIVAEFFRKRFSRFAGQFLPHEIQTEVGGIKKTRNFLLFGVDPFLGWWEKVGRSGGKWLFFPLLEPCPKPPRNRLATPGLSRGPWMRRIVSRFRRRG
jgi:hypothetical protein